MSDELKPCPFCGGTGAFVERLDYSSSYVQCDSKVSDGCHCMARGPVACQENDDEELPGEAGAIANWNRRAALATAWLAPETAPRDGSVILADTGYLWPVLACWSEYAEKWVTTELQGSVCDGLNDPGWVTESEHLLRGWMPTPATRCDRVGAAE